MIVVAIESHQGVIDKQVTTVGLNIAQNVFQVHGIDAAEKVVVLPKALTLQNLDAYERDVADPAAVYRDPQKQSLYLRMYGNICFDTRDQYINFPWSSERR